MAFDVLATHKEINLVRNNLLENLATIEPTSTASTDYDKDAYLVFNGYLYITTEAITAGDTLDPGEGGNIARVDVASQFGSGSVELTQAEYDALSEDEKMDDVLYLITDSPDNYLDEVFGDFATVEYTNTASKDYAVGKYLVYGNKLYKVTTAITSGGTIVTSGASANVEQTTVGNELSNTFNEVLKNTTGLVQLNTNIRYQKIYSHIVVVYGTQLSPVKNTWTTVGTLPSAVSPVTPVTAAGSCGPYAIHHMGVTIGPTGKIDIASDAETQDVALSGYFCVVYSTT